MTQARRYQWRFAGHTGVARPGTLRLRAPDQEGRFVLTVTANAHSDRAIVVVRGGVMSVTVAQAAAVAGALGLAVVLVTVDRASASQGSSSGPAGSRSCEYLLPDVSGSRLAVAGAAGLVLAVGAAWVLLRWPWALAFILACIPLRLPVDIGSEEVNLLVPLYGFVAALGVALAWSFLRGDGRYRELGPVTWPLAAFVAWSGVSLIWADDVRRGAIFMGAFLLPFPVLALGVSRLPWRGRWLTWMWGGLVATALLYALVGWYQWFTREVFWNPSVIVFNAYAPFFRVNSVFWDPSVYGRYLAVAVLVSISGIVLGGVRGWRIAGLYAVVISTWLGLVISFSQSSFVALMAGTVVAAGVAWGSRATLSLLGLAVVTLAVAFAVPQIRTSSSASHVPASTGSRPAARISSARACGSPPTIPCSASARAGSHTSTRAGIGIVGRDPKHVASHTTPVTVTAETGVPGSRSTSGSSRQHCSGRCAGSDAGSRRASRSRSVLRSSRSRFTACSTPPSSRTR